MLAEMKAAYGGAARVALAVPLLFFLPFAAELLQHVVEYRIGVFESVAAMQVHGADAARLDFGQVKIFALLVINFWVTRQLARQDGARLTLIGDRHALLLFLGVMIWGLATALLQQFAPAWLAPILPGANTAMLLAGIFGVVVMLVDIYLTVWKVGAALGNDALNIPASFRLIHGNFWWSLAYVVLMFLPLIAVHYGLNYAAAGRPQALLWPMLVIDALVVGYLGLVLVAVNYRIARRAVARAGASLLPV